MVKYAIEERLDNGYLIVGFLKKRRNGWCVDGGKNINFDHFPQDFRPGKIDRVRFYDALPIPNYYSLKRV